MRGRIIAMFPLISRVALTTLLLLTLLPSRADACGCCDGWGDTTLLGWSERGNLLTVEEATEGCSPRAILQVLRRPGEERMPLCFDLQDEPERPRHCHDGFPGGDVAMEEAEVAAAVAAHSRRRYFPLPVTQLDPANVRVELHRRAATEEEMDEDDGVAMSERYLFVEVAIRAVDGTWHPSATYRTYPGSPEHADMSWYEEDAPDGRGEEFMEEDAPEFRTPPGAITVRAYPSPDGAHVVLSVRGQNEAPGTGFFPATVVWGTMPDAAAPGRADAEGVTLGIERGTPSARSSDAGVAVSVDRLNAWALRAHGRGAYATSATWFARLISMDPANPVLRYNLASALARLGQVHVALDLLEGLREAQGCARCRERLRRARRDPDFAALRRDARFRAIARR